MSPAKFIFTILLCWAIETAPATVVVNSYSHVVAGGGGGAAWTDVIDFGSAEITGDTDNTFVVWQTLTLPAGTVSKLRIKSGANYISPCPTKLALYDNSGNIVGSTTYYPEITINAANTIFECVLSTPVTSSAANYKIALQTNCAALASYKYHGSGGARNYGFIGAYASFPTASLPSSAGSDTVATAMGVYITP